MGKFKKPEYKQTIFGKEILIELSDNKKIKSGD